MVGRQGQAIHIDTRYLAAREYKEAGRQDIQPLGAILVAYVIVALPA